MTVPADTERRLLDADDARCRAMLDHDLDALADMLTDDIVYTHSSARVDNKENYLADMRSGRLRYRVVQRKNVQIRLYGHVALMHGRVVMQVDIQGQPKNLENLFQSVWVEEQGRWQMASWASTVIPPQNKTL